MIKISFKYSKHLSDGLSFSHSHSHSHSESESESKSESKSERGTAWAVLISYIVTSMQIAGYL